MAGERESRKPEQKPWMRGLHHPQAGEIMNKKICLYALSTCIHCRNTKELLNGKGVDYTCHEVDTLQGEERQKIIEEVRALNPSLSFPTLVIGDKIIVGFKKDEIEEALKA